VPIEQGGLSEYVIHLPLGGETYQVMPVVVMVACSAIAMVLVSLITRKPNEATIAKFF
jgi:SSS family solute:Na+ symporter